MRKAISIVILGLVLVLRAQGPINTHAKMKATYIYNFAVNTHFPTTKKSGSFKIGVYGKDQDLINSLGMLQGRKIGSQTASVSSISNISGASGYHIIYITHSHQSEVNSIVNQLGGKNVLLIVEGRNPIAQGINGYAIGFYPVNNRWVFDINSKSLENQGLLVTSKLQNLANRVVEN